MAACALSSVRSAPFGRPSLAAARPRAARALAPAPSSAAACPARRPLPPATGAFSGAVRLPQLNQPSLDSRAPVVCQADSKGGDLGETAKANLRRAAANCKRLGWMSFWTQLILSTISIVILLFSVAFSQTVAPTFSLYLTLVGILAGFVSTLWAFRYTRMSNDITRYLAFKEGVLSEDEAKKVKKISKPEVVRTMNWGSVINLLGLGSTILGLQATVGVLVAKTLSNATANPFMAGGSGSYNPVLALDVFLVQASSNTLLGHFVGIVFTLWLLRSIDGTAGYMSSSPPSSPKSSDAPAAA
eukprot:jgi/Tetstr1/447651/TSEL_035009.t2